MLNGCAIRSDRCEYCGSVFYDWAVIDTEKPSFIKIKRGNRYYWLRAQMEALSVHSNDEQSFYADNLIYTVRSPDYTIDARFRAVPFKTPYNESTMLLMKEVKE